MSEHSHNRSKVGRKYQLILLALLFLVPPGAAYVLFYTDYRTSSGANYGQLISPAKPLADIILTTADGQEFKFSDLRNKWVLLYLGSSKCNEACSDNLYKINQVRLAQGKNTERVTGVYIVPASASDDEINNISGKYPGILLLLAQMDAFAGLIDQFDNNTEAALQSSERVYIVDPLGNLMMSYEAKADPSGMRKDLKRLLKLSQVG